MFWQATPETVDKVCNIVRKQLAVPENTAVTGESKFASLGADSLDTVCLLFISIANPTIYSWLENGWALWHVKTCMHSCN